MNITKGQKLLVRHNRKGTFYGMATEDFDSATTEWYPIVIHQDNNIVRGLATDYYPGERIPCRASLCSISTVEAMA